jgi:glyoxylase-like metal-dependent hydrolase (beta-lactamase superfamily II)
MPISRPPLPEAIHLIPLPLDERRTVNATLIEGSPLTLVDTGFGTPKSLRLLEAGLARHGHALRDIEQIVITHAHLDHFGAASAIAAASGARVIGDAGGAAIMQHFASAWAATQTYRLALLRAAGAPAPLLERARRWHEHHAGLGQPVRLDAGLVAGDMVTMGGATWQVLSVPGHAASSIALYQPESQLLLSGDIVVSIGSTNVTLHQVGDGTLPAGWQQMIADSLRSLTMLDLQRIYPGHGEAIDDPASALADRLQRIKSRLAQARALLDDRPRTAYELAQVIYEPSVAGSMAGLIQAIGYLDTLELRGQARATEEDGLRRYLAADVARHAV